MTTLKKFSIRLILATVVVLSLLILFTQFIAYRFDFHPDLGRPVIAWLYNPLDGLTWYQEYGQRYPRIFRNAVAVTGLVTVMSGLSALFVSLKRFGLAAEYAEAEADLVYGYQEEIRELKSVNNRLEKEINLLRIKNEQIMKHRRDRYREAKKRLEKQAMASMRFDHLDDLRQYVQEKLLQEGFSGQDECLLEERGR